jgi:signal transduction histidine kinase
MKRTWQIWSLFFLCLLAVAIAMSWLSLKTFQLESLREANQAGIELASREAELQERISSALYRLDLKMLPLVAQEAARPQYFYQPFFKVASTNDPDDGSKQSTAPHLQEQFVASPLLSETSRWVRLHFEIDAENRITSPRFPEGKQRTEALQNNQVSPESLTQTQARINEARKLFEYQTLAQKTALPTGSLLVTSSSSLSNLNATSLAYSMPAVDNFLNQINTPQSADLPSPDEQSPIQQTDSPAVQSSDRIKQQRARADQRINSELTQRRNSTQEVAQLNAYLGNNVYNGAQISGMNLPLAIEPNNFLPMQPIWLGENLVMARRASDRWAIQCCWLDWSKIRSELQNEVAELLPGVQFEAVTAETELKIGTALTTIPVQIIVDRPKMLAILAWDAPELETSSALPISLFAAWCCLGLAAIASALLLHGVIRLSERRAAFVSAVTHELRTPLTTFRMYSEMLADGMVAPEKQQQYANTLKTQADRLAHLVDNVLQFARLERGPAKIATERVTIAELFDRFGSRLGERATDSQMQLEIEVDNEVAGLSIVTQAATIEQILFNLLDNACKYAQTASDRRIIVTVDSSGDRFRFCVRDFGPGILPSDRKRMYQPFQQSQSATANAIPGVGLGLALCKRMARSLGGNLVDEPGNPGMNFILDLPRS